MSSFAEDVLKPTLRAQLLRLARWENADRLGDHADTCVARLVRTVAPALTGQDDEEVLDRFALLWSAVHDLDQAKNIVDTLLAELVPVSPDRTDRLIADAKKAPAVVPAEAN